MDSQKVAFVCLHDSAKSLIAAEYFNRIAIDRNLPLRATTSGPEPDNEVPENVVAGLKSRGIDVGQYHPTLTAADQLSDTNLSNCLRSRIPHSPMPERWACGPRPTASHCLTR
jgi:protein-tyrosine-phosphatase